MTTIDLTSLVRLDDKVAVVTGASSGLGERFARVLHAAGATVILAARRIDRLEALSEALGDRAVALSCDVGVDADREALIAKTIDRCGHLDVLVNSAGIGDPAPAESFSIDDFRQTMEINVTAVFHLCQLAGRQMLARGEGAIVNISSMLGLVAAAPISHVAYCASKAAVVNMTRQLAAEWAYRGVRVNALAPGWFESEMTADMWVDPSSTEYVRRGTPLRRGGSVDELDAALLLLVGAGGSFVHGQTIVVDGGWTLR